MFFSTAFYDLKIKGSEDRPLKSEIVQEIRVSH